MTGTRPGLPGAIPVTRSPLSVAITAFELDPHRGSEAFIAWNWTSQLCARVGRVVAVVPDWIAGSIDNGVLPPNLEIIAVPRPQQLQWRRLPGHYAAYVTFLSAAQSVVRDLDCDIAHQLTWGTPFWGSSIATARGRRVLGPVGISAPIPIWAVSGLPASSARTELVRRGLTRWPGPPVSATRAALGADHVFASDRRTAALCHRLGRPWTAMPQDGANPREDADVLGLAARRDLVWAGRLKRSKGAPLAVRAFARALPELPGQTRLVVVGDGPDMPNLQQLRTELGLGDRLVLLGRQPGAVARASIASARALVFSSLRDTFGGVVLEAAEAGTPIVLAVHGGVDGLASWLPREAFWGGHARSLPGIVAAMAAGMVAASTAAPEAWAGRSRTALEFARLHSWPSRADRMVATYMNLMSGSVHP